MSARDRVNHGRVRLRTLIASTVTVVLTGCASGPGNGPASLDQPLDTTDYAANRFEVERFYRADPVAYWSQFGLPAVARLDMLVDPEPEPEVPDDAFAALRATFDRDAFAGALDSGELPPRFTALYMNAVGDGLALWPAVTRAIGTLVLELDAERMARDVPHAETLAAAELAELFLVAFPSAAEAYAPSAPDKEPLTPLEPPLDPVCQAGSTSFEPPVTSRPPGTQDKDTSSSRNWTDIPNILWDTTYNASCAGQAVGPCAAKLGIRGDGISGNTMTCQDWNQLSRAIGAEERGKGGASLSNIASWFRGKGYCASTAYDGLFESACDEARKALARGCDVLMYYKNEANTSAHIEMVRGITTNANDSEQCTVQTWSWGQRESVTYDSGRYSNKSDGRRYRTAGEAKSYLEGSGKAKFIYYCSC